jgi:hypothetical protein
VSVHRWKLGITVVLAACTTAETVDQSAATATPATGIEGAWRLARLKPAAAEAVVAPAGLYVFAPGHYSVVYATAGTRPAFADDGAPTTAEKLSAYDSFVANAGSYVVTGDTLLVRPVVSRNPGFMGGGEDRFLMRFSGDTVWLTGVVGAFRWASGKGNGSTGSDSLTLVRAR